VREERRNAFLNNAAYDESPRFGAGPGGPSVSRIAERKITPSGVCLVPVGGAGGELLGRSRESAIQ